MTPKNKCYKLEADYIELRSLIKTLEYAINYCDEFAHDFEPLIYLYRIICEKTTNLRFDIEELSSAISDQQKTLV